MRKLALLLWILSSLSVLTAQNTNVKTVLYLIPFFGEEYNNYSKNKIKTSADIDNEPIYSLVSFWEGAQMALDEYETSPYRINVIVKDITYDNKKLVDIMENEALMSQVDLIIGPFFAPQFEIAANYAKNHQIPIVNPFTSKVDILEGNEYVYKVQSSAESMAETIRQRWLGQNETSEILLWTERGADIPALQRCERIFTQLGIPYEFVIDGDKSGMKGRLSHHKRHVVMAFLPSEATIIARTRDLGVEDELPNTVFIVPEEWLGIGTLPYGLS